MIMSNQESRPATARSIITNGNNNGQIAMGETVIQIGAVNGGTVNFQPATSSGNGKPAGDDPLLLLPAGEREQLAALRQALRTLFDEGELRDLVFDLAIDYDNLPGPAKKDKARELVAYCWRRNDLAELRLAIQRRRPGAFDDEITQGRPD
jgi:hypothetical protein